jgi:uncharacterized membrane protein
MNDQERINVLEEEVEKLRLELQQQQKSINELNAKLGSIRSVHPGNVSGKPIPGFHFSLENFIGLRLIQFIGIIVLVIGLSIGVKYAIDLELISVVTRIWLAYGAGILLFLLSTRLKEKYKVFSAILFSGGMASLYFTTYAAFSYYHLLSFGISFGLMIALTLFTVYEAIVYNREEIAWLGLVGAYGIPFLINRNEERADLLFLYVSIINIGVVFLCIREQWKRVGRVAEIITWVLFLAWTSTRYTIQQQNVALAFLIFFFILFAFNIAGNRLINKKPLDTNDTYYLVLNLIAFYLGSLFVFGSRFSDTNIALITFLVSVFYGLQALIYHTIMRNETFTTRMHALVALVLFLLFIGFNWDGFIVTLLWLMCAVIMFAWGFRARSYQARMASILLIGITLFKLVMFDSLTFSTVQKVIAYLVLGILLLGVSFFYQKFKQKIFEGRE